MNQVYGFEYRMPEGTHVTKALAADDRREASRVARHVAAAGGWGVELSSVAVCLYDPTSGRLLFEGDFLVLAKTFDRKTRGLYAKTPWHAAELAAPCEQAGARLFPDVHPTATQLSAIPEETQPAGSEARHQNL